MGGFVNLTHGPAVTPKNQFMSVYIKANQSGISCTYSFSFE
jgi:hypothetical protein